MGKSGSLPRWQLCRGISGSFRVEWVAGFVWNQWQPWSGIRSKAIKELESAGQGLACRVPTKGVRNLDDVELRYRPSTFMLSPDYIYPGTKFEKEIRHVWSQAINQSRHRKQGAIPTQPHSAPTEVKPAESEPAKRAQDNTGRKSNRPTRSLFGK